jgi:hypothetical protein
MKHIIVITCLLSGLLGFSGTVRGKALKAGGYSNASVTQKDVEEAAAFALTAKARELAKKKGQKSRLELVRVLAAQTQVVAGINYRLRLEVKVNGAAKEAEAVVWHQPWKKTAPWQLTSWKWELR